MKTTIISIISLCIFTLAGYSVDPINISKYASNGTNIYLPTERYNIFESGHFIMLADAYSNGSGVSGSSNVKAYLWNDGSVVASVECFDADGVSWKWDHDEDKDYTGWVEHATYTYSVITTAGVSGSINLKVNW